MNAPMNCSEPAKNYYVDVHIQDQIAALEMMFGLSREDSGARCTESLPSLDHTTTLQHSKVAYQSVEYSVSNLHQKISK